MNILAVRFRRFVPVFSLDVLVGYGTAHMRQTSRALGPLFSAVIP